MHLGARGQPEVSSSLSEMGFFIGSLPSRLGCLASKLQEFLHPHCLHVPSTGIIKPDRCKLI